MEDRPQMSMSSVMNVDNAFRLTILQGTSTDVKSIAQWLYDRDSVEELQTT